jgi:hypothetical protein
VGGDAEQPLDVGLAGDQQRGERGRHPLVAQGQAQVLGHRVDRRAADDAQPAEAGVGGMGLGQVGAHHDDHRMLAEPPRELIGGGHRPRLVAEPRPGALELPVRGGDRLGPGAGGGRDLLPQRQVPLRQLPAQRRIAHEHQPHRAPVAAVGREPGQLNGPEQHLVGHRLVAVVAAGVLGAHRVFEFHARTPSPAVEE